MDSKLVHVKWWANKAWRTGRIIQCVVHTHFYDLAIDMYTTKIVAIIKSDNLIDIVIVPVNNLHQFGSETRCK